MQINWNDDSYLTVSSDDEKRRRSEPTIFIENKPILVTAEERPPTTVSINGFLGLHELHHRAMAIDLQHTFGLPADAGIGPIQAMWCPPETQAELWRDHHLREADKYATAAPDSQWTHASAVDVAEYCGDICVQTVRNWVLKKGLPRSSFKRIPRQMVQEILEEHGYNFKRFCARKKR